MTIVNCLKHLILHEKDRIFVFCFFFQLHYLLIRICTISLATCFTLFKSFHSLQ
ncbi:uncharacterized protein BX663DRAFT_513255 [Cokeromyces recurvatus]|uniref:uncharacterized protein n=1 Tax=Cokeromyces recurvatus TaxID=90255 RepID=UPI00221FC477|nr:uncharacterized protein BX663DRAFT_513255 [Cokeromyces recurvatus]KAI7901550.1 hypothetical protein BX663DRAFT_513255 [Cokeromyces recurvatus]